MPAPRTLKISGAPQTALKHHQAGQLQHAEHIYRQVLVGRSEQCECESTTWKHIPPGWTKR